MTTMKKKTKTPPIPSKTVQAFDHASLEHMLDRAFVGSTVNTGLFNQVVSYVDNHDIKDEMTFNAHMNKAAGAWCLARDTSKLPTNSTLRSVLCKVRGALNQSISFFDTEGNMLGATELGRHVSESKAESLTDEQKIEIITKKLKTILTKVAALDKAHIKRIQATINTIMDSML